MHAVRAHHGRLAASSLTAPLRLWAQAMATIACAPTRADTTCKQLAAANALGLAPDAYERISLPFDTESTYAFKLDEHREAVTRTFEAKSLKLLDEPKVTMQLRKVVAQLVP